MPERVVKCHGLTVSWPRPARTLKGALYRIEELRNAIRWMIDDLESNEQSWRRMDQENRHLRNLLEARWNANDARLSNSLCDCGGRDCLGLPAVLAGEAGKEEAGG